MAPLLSRRVVLLDMDGVVLHHAHPALRVISHKSVRYVSSTLNVSMFQAERINKLLYTEFSHTLLGLRQVYNADQTVSDFSRYVYDAHSMSQLVTGCKEDKAVRQRAVEVSSLLLRCDRYGIPAYVFSNAPSEWCLAALEAMNLMNDQHGLNEERVLGSDHAVFDGRLKPSQSVYDSVERFLQHTLRSSDVSVDFVDDSFRNLTPVIGRPGWTALHFVEQAHASSDSVAVRTPRLRSVFNMKEVASFVTRSLVEQK